MTNDQKIFQAIFSTRFLFTQAKQPSIIANNTKLHTKKRPLKSGLV
jgi:hypothetical protein